MLSAISYRAINICFFLSYPNQNRVMKFWVMRLEWCCWKAETPSFSAAPLWSKTTEFCSRVWPYFYLGTIRKNKVFIALWRVWVIALIIFSLILFARRKIEKIFFGLSNTTISKIGFFRKIKKCWFDYPYIFSWDQHESVRFYDCNL